MDFEIDAEWLADGAKLHPHPKMAKNVAFSSLFVWEGGHGPESKPKKKYGIAIF